MQKCGCVRGWIYHNSLFNGLALTCPGPSLAPACVIFPVLILGDLDPSTLKPFDLQAIYRGCAYPPRHLRAMLLPPQPAAAAMATQGQGSQGAGLHGGGGGSLSQPVGSHRNHHHHQYMSQQPNNRHGRASICGKLPVPPNGRIDRYFFAPNPAASQPFRAHAPLQRRGEAGRNGQWVSGEQLLVGNRHGGGSGGGGNGTQVVTLRGLAVETAGAVARGAHGREGTRKEGGLDEGEEKEEERGYDQRRQGGEDESQDAGFSPRSGKRRRLEVGNGSEVGKTGSSLFARFRMSSAIAVATAPAAVVAMAEQGVAVPEGARTAERWLAASQSPPPPQTHLPQSQPAQDEIFGALRKSAASESRGASAAIAAGGSSSPVTGFHPLLATGGGDKSGGGGEELLLTYPLGSAPDSQRTGLSSQGLARSYWSGAESGSLGPDGGHHMPSGGGATDGSDLDSQLTASGCEGSGWRTWRAGSGGSAVSLLGGRSRAPAQLAMEALLNEPSGGGSAPLSQQGGLCAGGGEGGRGGPPRGVNLGGYGSSRHVQGALEALQRWKQGAGAGACGDCTQLPLDADASVVAGDALLGTGTAAGISIGRAQHGPVPVASAPPPSPPHTGAWGPRLHKPQPPPQFSIYDSDDDMEIDLHRVVSDPDLDPDLVLDTAPERCGVTANGGIRSSRLRPHPNREEASSPLRPPRRAGPGVALGRGRGVGGDSGAAATALPLFGSNDDNYDDNDGGSDDDNGEAEVTSPFKLPACLPKTISPQLQPEVRGCVVGRRGFRALMHRKLRLSGYSLPQFTATTAWSNGAGGAAPAGADACLGSPVPISASRRLNTSIEVANVRTAAGGAAEDQSGVLSGDELLGVDAGRGGGSPPRVETSGKTESDGGLLMAELRTEALTEERTRGDKPIRDRLAGRTAGGSPGCSTILPGLDSGLDRNCHSMELDEMDVGVVGQKCYEGQVGPLYSGDDCGVDGMADAAAVAVGGGGRFDTAVSGGRHGDDDDATRGRLHYYLHGDGDGGGIDDPDVMEFTRALERSEARRQQTQRQLHVGSDGAEAFSAGDLLFPGNAGHAGGGGAGDATVNSGGSGAAAATAESNARAAFQGQGEGPAAPGVTTAAADNPITLCRNLKQNQGMGEEAQRIQEKSKELRNQNQPIAMDQRSEGRHCDAEAETQGPHDGGGSGFSGGCDGGRCQVGSGGGGGGRGADHNGAEVKASRADGGGVDDDDAVHITADGTVVADDGFHSVRHVARFALMAKRVIDKLEFSLAPGPPLETQRQRRTLLQRNRQLLDGAGGTIGWSPGSGGAAAAAVRSRADLSFFRCAPKRRNSTAWGSSAAAVQGKTGPAGPGSCRQSVFVQPVDADAAAAAAGAMQQSADGQMRVDVPYSDDVGRLAGGSGHGGGWEESDGGSDDVMIISEKEAGQPSDGRQAGCIGARFSSLTPGSRGPGEGSGSDRLIRADEMLRRPFQPPRGCAGGAAAVSAAAPPPRRRSVSGCGLRGKTRSSVVGIRSGGREALQHQQQRITDFSRFVFTK
ncbi:hypothetical protein VaNZ11_011242 [Volvox africanus]|uniref:Uncharacterized protein n=1 Tax=Volvox africanus TaxID=51714 RepID=A0ABQ5SC91_9CHLO|nr:hypothetical protein VaNZ11_011242 [Volvox africanus]